jgi:Ser/Thr protein kinase RdoA (MazF antagonist)
MSAHAHAIDEVLARYELSRIGEPLPVADSVVNENFRVETNAGPRFVRVHAPGRAIASITAEHEIIAFAATAGVPVNPPLADHSGETVHESAGLLLALYPWLDGFTFGRDTTLTKAAVVLLGEMEGRIHSALASYEGPQSRIQTGVAWTTAGSITKLEQVLAAIDTSPASQAAFRQVPAEIRLQLALLESEGRSHGDFDSLTRHTVHGDYHNRNVMFAATDQVQAVIDLEMAHPLPPVFELLRAITFTLGEGLDVDGTLVEAWLGGYGRHARIPYADCELGVEMWWQHLLHGTWAYATRFIQHDTRVDPFVPWIGPHIARFSSDAYRAQLTATLKRNVGR